MLTRLTRTRSEDAAAFYQSWAGQRTASLLNRRLNSLLPDLRARRLLGIGYPGPYLPATAGCAISARLQHPQTQRPFHHIVQDCLIESGRLPFDDLSMDTVLVVHGLEFTRSAADFLRAAWKVMTDDGYLILVVPNRSGYWAHTDATPFGHGVPFSTRQLTRLLEQGLFQIEHHTGALMTPPALLSRLSGTLPERVGKMIRYPCAGVHIVVARKNVYAGLPLMDEKARVTVPRQVAEPA